MPKVPFSKTHPHLVDSWEDDQEMILFSAGSAYKAQWKCEKGHVFSAQIKNRTKRGDNCPYCSGKKVLTGFNDLATKYPEIAREWHSKNEIKATKVAPMTSKKYHWQCERGHVYMAAVVSRTRMGSGCPYCSKTFRKLLVGFNDLLTVHPEIAQEWDTNKNEVSPSNVLAGGTEKRWWKCQQEGHSYSASLSKRINGNGCPYCSNKKILKGFNDLATTHPEIAQEWSKENHLKADEVNAGSNTIKEWICSSSHTWESTIRDRTKSMYGCPYCSGRYAIQGETDLATTHPELAKEWNDERDIGTISFGSTYKAQWKCTLCSDHVWTAAVCDRTRKNGMGTGCPQCCAKNFISNVEQELYNYIESIIPIGSKIQQSNREIIGKEIDIYLPQFNVAVEFNGLYWHSEKMGKDKWSHHSKWKSCNNKGIQLITIWEDDWRDKRNVIKKMICHKLGLGFGKSIYARNTEFSIIESKEAKDFLKENHIQGSVNGFFTGLREKSTQNLIAVAGWKRNKEKRVAEMTRFATSARSPGAFSKLLKHSEKILHEDGIDRITTFSSHEISDGSLYNKNGFIADKEIDPDYSYVYKNSRVHKFNFRISRFKKDALLIFEKGKTESELAIMNNLNKVWDCGKTRWTKEI